MSRRLVGREYATVSLSIFIVTPEEGLYIWSNPGSLSLVDDCEGGVIRFCVLPIRCVVVCGVLCCNGEWCVGDEREAALCSVLLMVLLLCIADKLRC